jgi:hypothetical protein
MKNIFFKHECFNKNRKRTSSLSNKDNNLICSFTTINNRNTLRQIINQSEPTYNINRINISKSRCIIHQNEQSSFKIINNKNSIKNQPIVKEFRKKIIFERSNNPQSKQADISTNSLAQPPISLNEKKLNWRIDTKNLNKKKIVFSFNSPNKCDTNMLQSNQMISNSMLSLSGKYNSRTKYSMLKSNKNDNIVIHFNTNNKYMAKSVQYGQTSTDQSPTSTKSLLAVSPPHLPYSRSFTLQTSNSNQATSTFKTHGNLSAHNNPSLKKTIKIPSETKNNNSNFSCKENLSKDTSNLFLKRLSSLSNFKRNESL